MKHQAKLLLEKVEAWDRFITALQDPPSGSGPLKIPIPSSSNQLILEILEEQQIICYSIEPKRRRGKALPVTSSGDQ